MSMFAFDPQADVGSLREQDDPCPLRGASHDEGPRAGPILPHWKNVPAAGSSLQPRPQPMPAPERIRPVTGMHTARSLLADEVEDQVVRHSRRIVQLWPRAQRLKGRLWLLQ